jgi:hypothetical protein
MSDGPVTELVYDMMIECGSTGNNGEMKRLLAEAAELDARLAMLPTAEQVEDALERTGECSYCLQGRCILKLSKRLSEGKL